MADNNQSSSLLAGIPQHAERFKLTRELHARPFEKLAAPCEIFMFAKLTGEGVDAEQNAQLHAFCERFAIAPPDDATRHFSADFGKFRFRWERHAEFTSSAAIVKGIEGKPFSLQPPVELLEWLEQCGGELLVATHLSIQQQQDPSNRIPSGIFAEVSLVASEVATREGFVCTDLLIQEDGFNRILLFNRALTPLKMGRVARRLLEISTYRNMALLALPTAQKIGPRIAGIDESLSRLLIRMRADRRADQEEQQGIDEDDALLNELSRLSAEIEELSSHSTYRFSASNAYYALVNSRLDELNEQRISGYQTIGEFLDRRLSPAMRTCESVAERLENLALRASRAGNLLRTRVDLALERQNHGLLNSMDQRARLQLRLQETVEGLSIAAITYYMVGLVSYGAKTLKSLGFGVHPDLIAGASVIPIALMVGLGVKHIRRSISGAGPKADHS